MEKEDTLRAYTLDALHILHTSLELASGSEPAFYRVAAVQLRLLLCDTTYRHDRTENISLIPRLLPEVRLQPLTARGFDRSQPPMLLDEWLEQPLPLAIQPAVTLRQVIRQVCDQDGGAHLDPHRQTGLPQDINPALWVGVIGNYVWEEISLQLEKTSG
jgi:hypothetical protein